METNFIQSIKQAIAVVLILILFGCGATREPYIASNYQNWPVASAPDTNKLLYSVFLIGDAGAPSKDGQEPSFKLLEGMLYKFDTIVEPYLDTAAGMTTPVMDTVIRKTPDPRYSVVWLGDNIYNHGLPPVDASDRPEKERAIIEQMKVVQEMKERTYWVPGNHDWDEQGPGGYAAVLRQEIFVENYLDSVNVWLPDNACPGPVDIEISPNLVLILLDSQWWLHRYYKPTEECGVLDQFDLIVQLDDMIEKHQGKNIIISQHHPLFSNSSHGGWFTLKDYLFPISLVRPLKWWAYIPLFPIGSIYPLMRQYGISRQDMTNPIYNQMKQGILSVVEDKPYIIMATGHDHNLQLKKFGSLYHIVSGSGCKDNYVRKGNDVIFAYEHKGFMRLNYYTNGEVWVETWIPEEDGSKGKMVFRSIVYSRLGEDVVDVDEIKTINYKDSVTTIAAGEQYKAGAFKRFLFGDHYRDVWTAPVEVPLLDIKTLAGGLQPTKLGGGMQTVSLRLRDTANIEYTLRLVNKDPEAILPTGFQQTFANDLIQDQISAAHPFGALAVSGMEKALGIYHTAPDLYFVPNTPLLGPYVEEFGNTLAMLEVRPDEDLSRFKRFGKTENAVSTTTMYRHIFEDNDNWINQPMFLKARLFDMLVGDWDRHEDQWRWAEFENKGKGSEFRPIARDRDQVFFKFDGIMPWIASRKWVVRKLQDFDYKFNDIKGLNESAAHLDRNLLTELTREDWQRMAKEIQAELTDSVIIKSLKNMPMESYELSGEEIYQKLISRREQLPAVAESYYEILAKKVDITGTDKHEYFNIERLNNNETRVTVYKTKKEGDLRKHIYQRTFYTNETQEIRLYGLAGQDSFIISGIVSKGPKIRVIGGPGEDAIINESRVKGSISHKVKIYDFSEEVEQNNIKKGTDSRLITSNEAWVNEFDPESFRYNYFGPKLFVEYNVDDGIFLGGGFTYTTYNFRKDPAETKQELVANYATSTGAFTAKYNGNYYDLFAKDWDFQLFAEAFGPKYVLNYFGLGNGTEKTRPIDFYRINLNKIDIYPSVNYRLNEFTKFGAGPVFEYAQVEANPNTIISHPAFPEVNTSTESSNFLGAHFFGVVDLRDDKLYTRRGLYWNNTFKYLKEMGGDVNMLNMQTDFRFYVTTNNFPSTFAIRFGAATSVGEFDFYQANFLGNKENLRGYRKTRFAGNSSFFTNFDTRIELFDFSAYIIAGNGGVIGFYDVGRVWGGENSTEWHMGYGPGLFINVFDYFLVSGHYGFSKEGQFINVDFGFFF